MTTASRFRLAEHYLDGGDPLQALRLLDAIDAEQARQTAVRLLRARALYHSAQLGRAREELTALVAEHPADTYARFLLGRTLERQSRPAEALPHYRLAAAMSGDPDHARRRDDVAARVGRPAQADGTVAAA